MGNTERSLRVLGLSLMATMGLVAFMVASAQAVTWDVAGKEITSNVTAGGIKGDELLTVAPQNLVIHCKATHVKEGLLLPDQKIHLIAVMLNCVTLVKGVENKGCVPDVLPIKLVALPILHSGIVWLLAEPETGVNLTVIHYNEGTCALPSLPAVTGSVVFECYTGALVRLSCAHPRVKQLIRAVPSPLKEELFPADVLKYGLNVASLEGEGEVFLTGANEGQTFNALI